MHAEREAVRHIGRPLVEVAHPRINHPAPERPLSRLVVQPVTESVARHPSVLLDKPASTCGLHGTATATRQRPSMTGASDSARKILSRSSAAAAQNS